MKKDPNRGRDRARSPVLVTWGGAAAVLAGTLFAAWGYLHRDAAPRLFAAIADKLDFVVPLLFMAGLIALHAQRRGGPDWLRWTGFLLGFLGSGWGLVYGVADMSAWYAYAGGRAWTSLLNWLPWLLSGLTLVGIAAVRVKALRGWDVLPLVTGAAGWAYYFTDSGGIVETRPGHVAFGALFSLGWMATGYTLCSRGGSARRRAPRA